MIRIKKLGNKIIDKDRLLDYINNLEDGSYNIFIEKSEVGQAKYFFYRDVIAEYLGYGTRKEKDQLHQHLKEKLLPHIFKSTENLNTEDYEKIDKYSTKFLSPWGWRNFIKNLEIYALSEFGVILK